LILVAANAIAAMMKFFPKPPFDHQNGVNKRRGSLTERTGFVGESGSFRVVVAAHNGLVAGSGGLKRINRRSGYDGALMSDDPTISGFLLAARENEAAALNHHKSLIQSLERVDQHFRSLMLFSEEDQALARVMVMVAHSYYLSAIRIALSGQSPSTFTALRACVECALYALIMQNEEGADKAWLNRKNDRDTCRNTFTVAKGFRFLEFDPNLRSLAKQAYDACIDFGAHPNPIAVMKNLEITDIGVSFTSLQGFESFSVARSLIACIETGLASILILAQVFRHAESSKAIHASAIDLMREFQELLKQEGFVWSD
jgi:hypothetical protein